ncbi:MAG: hypothetical protein LBC35_03610 [Coriobacteriales bacterium]|jgi:hypothetical protein|nr:hypothetical protein [Coriobacteriales bacterium]
MATYLVDYENRGKKRGDNGLVGIEELSFGDTVVVFLGKTSQVPQAILDAGVNKSKARVIFHKCRKTAKNYLDFQLVSYLGHLIGATGEKKFYIISDDKGYFAAIDYWLTEHPDVEIIRQSTIGPENKTPVESDENTLATLPPAQKINKLDPPESIRKVARGIYSRQGIKIGYISQLYEEMRTSQTAKVFAARLGNLLDKQQLEAMKPALMEMFERYAEMRH